MACEYCDGSKKSLITQTRSEVEPDNSFVHPYGKPALCVSADYQWVYLDINFCPMCGRDLRGDE